MLTLGGMIEEGSRNDKLQKSGIYDLHYINTSSAPLKISVPPLTTHEKQWIDQKIKRNLRADKLAFELNEQLLENYKEYYKHYPQYYEAII
jgi:hypothetical protein